MRPSKTVFRNDEIPGRIHALQPFLSEGKLADGTRRWEGLPGPAVSLGHLPARLHASARSAVYVVYSYGTPVAWVTEDDENPRETLDPYVYHIPDVGYSVTTGTHQTACMEAWSVAMRRQGDYRHWPGRHRETVQIPGNAEVYGRSIRARAGGMDGVRPGQVVGRSSRRDAEEQPAFCEPGFQGPLASGWTGHRAHP